MSWFSERRLDDGSCCDNVVQETARASKRNGPKSCIEAAKFCLFWPSPTVYPICWLQFATVAHSQNKQNFGPLCISYDPFSC